MKSMGSLMVVAGFALLLAGCGGPAGEDSVARTSGGGGAPVAASPAAGDGKRTAVPRESTSEAGEITRIDLQRFFELHDERRAMVVDVRPGLFYALGHIEGAISLPRKSFSKAYPATKAALDRAVADGKVLVLYCADENCPDAYAVGKRLSVEGYSTTIYEGGWKEWQQVGMH